MKVCLIDQRQLDDEKKYEVFLEDDYGDCLFLRSWYTVEKKNSYSLAMKYAKDLAEFIGVYFQDRTCLK